MTTSTSYSQPKWYTREEMSNRNDCEGIHCLLCDFWKDPFAQTVVSKCDCFNGSVERYIADKEFVRINSANMAKAMMSNEKEVAEMVKILERNYP